MKNSIDKQSLSEKAYKILLSMYPQQYRKRFGDDMQQAFRDMVEEENLLTVWFVVFKELPVNLLNEYVAIVRGGERSMKRNIVAVFIGVISIITLVIILTGPLNILERVLPNRISHEGNGPMSSSALLAYALSGIIVALMTKKSHTMTAMIAGGITWVLYALLELPDWAYYFGYAQHPIPLAAMGIPYYLELGVIVITLLGVGGFIGGILQNKISLLKARA